MWMRGGEGRERGERREGVWRRRRLKMEFAFQLSLDRMDKEGVLWGVLFCGCFFCFLVFFTLRVLLFFPESNGAP